VIVLNNLTGSTPVFTAVVMAPGAVSNFTGSYVAPTNCASTSVSTVTGMDMCTGIAVTNSASSTCPITTAPALAVTLTCPVGTVLAGGLITYTGTVRNSGNITLTNVTVVNNKTSPATVFSLASMAPGTTSNFTASFTTPIDACSVSSTVTATGNDSCTAKTTTNTASTLCPLLTAPQLALSQSCPVTPAVPGGLLTYTGSVSNAGNVSLTNVSVLNNLTGSTPVFTAVVMAPGSVSNFTGSYLAPTNCASTSVSTVTGRDQCTGIAVTNSASTACPILTTPQILVTAACSVNPGIPGGLATYSGSVRNVGNITLTNVVVLNSLTGTTPVFTASTLAPGAVTNFTGSYTVPFDASSATSTFSATGESICGGN